MNEKVVRKKKDPMSVLGVFSLGGRIPYKHREELYDDYIRRKIGLSNPKVKPLSINKMNELVEKEMFSKRDRA